MCVICVSFICIYILYNVYVWTHHFVLRYGEIKALPLHHFVALADGGREVLALVLGPAVGSVDLHIRALALVPHVRHRDVPARQRGKNCQNRDGNPQQFLSV